MRRDARGARRIARRGLMLRTEGSSEVDISLPNNQRQHRTLHIQKDALPLASCQLMCPVSAALASIFRMDPLPTAPCENRHETAHLGREQTTLEAIERLLC